METTTSLPVKKVTIMEDRAQVERAGEVQLQGGVTRVQVAGVSLWAVDRSLQVSVTGATLVDAAVQRRGRQKPKGGVPADASALRQRVDVLEKESRARGDAVARVNAQLELARVARTEVLSAIARGAGAGQQLESQWAQQLDLVSTRQRELDEAQRDATRAQQRTQAELAQAQFALRAAEEQERDVEAFLVLTLAGKGPCQVRVTYLIPCAVWRPAYRATLVDLTVQLEAEAVVWQRTGEDWDNVEVAFSTARPTLGTSPPTLTEDIIQLRDKSSPEKRVVDVAWREEAIQNVGETAGKPQLPGLDDGGEARLLKPASTVSIKSNGQPHRVPLFRFEARAQVDRVCAPELSSLVFVTARFPNQGGQVLLAGPVDLVRAAGFVGRGQLGFAAPGDTVKLSFGNEDGLQVLRERNEKVDTALLTGKQTTTNRVKLSLSNMGTTRQRVVVEERIPVSEVKEVEVNVLQKECQPAPSQVSAHGVARLEVDLEPNATATATFAWELVAASKVAGV